MKLRKINHRLSSKTMVRTVQCGEKKETQKRLTMLTLEQLQNALIGKYLIVENHLNEQDVTKTIFIYSIRPSSRRSNLALTINKGIPDEIHMKRTVLVAIATAGEYKADFGNPFGWLSYTIVPCVKQNQLGTTKEGDCANVSYTRH